MVIDVLILIILEYIYMLEIPENIKTAMAS